MNSYKYENLTIGLSHEFRIDIDESMENKFRDITGDTNPLHYDDEFAKSTSLGVNSHVSFGMLTASFYSTLAGVYLPGKYSLIHSIDIKFKNPVYVGNSLFVSGKIIDKQDELKLIIVDANIKNEKNKTVSKAIIKIIVLK